ncbi:MAG: penicillin-binding protein 2 [Acidimicrobiia bacterium]|nr:penicillin-binding protein 2 [Acidimicrobiia bacterium]
MSTTKAAVRAEQRRAIFRRTTTPIDPRNRLIALLVAFVVIGAGFVALLVDLQTVRPERYRVWGEDQRRGYREIAGYRGAITDRNGFVLAASTPSHQIVANPSQVKDPGATAALLAPVLGIDSAELATKLTPDKPGASYSLLARHVDDAAVTQIQDIRSNKKWSPSMAGIFVKPEESRVYPAGDLASALVGGVDPDEQGTFGVEKIYNEVMKGSPGKERFERGQFGSISVGAHEVDPATAGNDVVLTIDHRIQYMAEQTLVEQCEKTEAEGATAVLADPRSGEVLAMASVARNDAGACVTTDYNAALVDVFEPGSVIKPLVMAAAADRTGLTADTQIEVPSRITVGGKTFVDHPPHPGAMFPVSEIIAESMNVGAIEIAQRMDPQTIFDYFTAFGLGQETAIEFPGESGGSLRQPEDWYGADHGAIPIGQGMSVTAAQLLSAYNVLANRGTYVAPSLIRSLGGGEGSLGSGVSDEPRRVVSEAAAAETTEALTAVVDRGTGRQAAIPGYTVAGKTGTAWKAFKDEATGKLTFGSDGNRRYVSSFVGFLPAERPELSMVVVVDQPRTDYMASAVAAPIFSEIGAYAARILPITPNHVDAGAGAAAGGRVRGTPAPLAAPTVDPLAPNAAGPGNPSELPADEVRTGGVATGAAVAADASGGRRPR